MAGSSAAQLRDLLNRTRPSTWQQGFPVHVRKQVALHIRQRLERGERLGTVARELDIHPTTAKIWTDKFTHDEPIGACFLPVQLSPRTVPQALTLTTPDGFVIGGFVEFDAVLAILRELR